MFIPEKAKFILRTLENNGYEAFLVGGCVRDAIMGKEPNDYDITTNATPEQILECFHNCRTLTNGVKHGTVGVVIDKDVVEVTTYRIDGQYSDNRHPDKVIFSNRLCDDLSRRDFTVNAIACSMKEEIVDIFSGVSDIDSKIIKCVGNPDTRFKEDALRILRALRFSCVLDFDIDNETAMSIHKNAKLLKNISLERIREEFCKLLCGIRIKHIFKAYYDVFCEIIPELKQDNSIDVKKIAEQLEKADCNIILRLCVLFARLFDKNRAFDVLTRLKFDNATKNAVCDVLSAIDTKACDNKVAVKKVLSTYGFYTSLNLCRTNLCLGNWTEEQCNYFHKISGQIKENGECISVAQLDVDGQDLIKNLDVSGKAVGDILRKLCNDVICEKIENKKSTLLYEAKAIAQSLEVL